MQVHFNSVDDTRLVDNGQFALEIHAREIRAAMCGFLARLIG